MRKVIFLTSFLIISFSITGQSFEQYLNDFNVCFEDGNYSCAEENMLKALPLIEATDNVELLVNSYSNLGTDLRRQDKNEEALEAFNRALEIDSNATIVLSNRASLKRFMKDMEGSIHDYTRALELDSNNEGLLLNRAASYKRNGDTLNSENDLILLLEL